MFGNVGLRDRLTFSVFGPAVNCVQRLQTMTKKYARPIVASSAFADYCGDDWSRLGRERLRGVEEEVTVMAPAALDQTVREDRHLPINSGLSDAEQVVLLHRDARRPEERKGI